MDNSLEYTSLKVGNVGSLRRCLDGSGATLRRRPFGDGVGVVGELGDHAGSRGEDDVDGCGEDGVDKGSNTVDELSEPSTDGRDDMRCTGDEVNTTAGLNEPS